MIQKTCLTTFISVLGIVACQSREFNTETKASDTEDIDNESAEIIHKDKDLPWVQCAKKGGWTYDIDKKGAPEFDLNQPVEIHVSKLGYTARITGTMDKKVLAKFANTTIDDADLINKVTKIFPHYSFPKVAAVHSVIPSNFSKVDPDSGKIKQTTFQVSKSATGLLVSVTFPVAIGAAGLKSRGSGSTLVGDFHFTQNLSPTVSNNSKAAWGGFPFLGYTSVGHAFHGPITNRMSRGITNGVAEQFWDLRRGAVSHGCNRMEGEHVLELAALLNCDNALTSGFRQACTLKDHIKNASIHIMNGFDFTPIESVTLEQAQASLKNKDQFLKTWVGVGLSNDTDPIILKPGSVEAKAFTENAKATISNSNKSNQPGWQSASDLTETKIDTYLTSAALSTYPAGINWIPARNFKTYDARTEFYKDRFHCLLK